MHSSSAAGRQQRDQRGDAPAPPQAVPVLGVVGAQDAQRRGGLLMRSILPAGRQQRDQRRDAPALPGAVLVPGVGKAHSLQRSRRRATHSGRAAGRQLRDQRRDAPGLPHAVPVLCVVTAQVAQRRSSHFRHSCWAAGRQQANQSGNTPALPDAVLVLRIATAQVAQRACSLRAQGGRAAGRQQADQSGDAPALPDVVPLLDVVHAQVAHRPRSALLRGGRAAGRQEPDERRGALALPHTVVRLAVARAPGCQRSRGALLRSSLCGCCPCFWRLCHACICRHLTQSSTAAPCQIAIERSSGPLLGCCGAGVPNTVTAQRALSGLLSHVPEELLGASRPTRAAGQASRAGCSQPGRPGHSLGCRRRIAGSAWPSQGRAGGASPISGSFIKTSKQARGRRMGLLLGPTLAALVRGGKGSDLSVRHPQQPRACCAVLCCAALLPTCGEPAFTCLVSSIRWCAQRWSTPRRW